MQEDLQEKVRLKATATDGEISETEVEAVASSKEIDKTAITDTKQIIDILTAEVDTITGAPTLSLLLMSSAVTIFWLSVASWVAIYPKPNISPSGPAILALICGLFTFIFCKVFFDRKQIPPIKKVGLKRAVSTSKNLKSRPIRVRRILQKTATSYVIGFEFVDATEAVNTLDEVIVRTTYGPVWRNVSTHTASNVATDPQPSSDTILPGYLFCDDDGQPMAISIESAVGWVYPD